jgi:hypothetical protein
MRGHVSEGGTDFVLALAEELLLCYREESKFGTRQKLIRKTEKGKTFEEGMIRNQRVKALWLKSRASKRKGSPQRVSLFGGFFCS